MLVMLGTCQASTGFLAALLRLCRHRLGAVPGDGLS
jgi:hypothetical protein